MGLVISYTSRKCKINTSYKVNNDHKTKQITNKSNLEYYLLKTNPFLQLKTINLIVINFSTKTQF